MVPPALFSLRTEWASQCTDHDRWQLGPLWGVAFFDPPTALTLLQPPLSVPAETTTFIDIIPSYTQPAPGRTSIFSPETTNALEIDPMPTDIPGFGQTKIQHDPGIEAGNSKAGAGTNKMPGTGSGSKSGVNSNPNPVGSWPPEISSILRYNQNPSLTPNIPITLSMPPISTPLVLYGTTLNKEGQPVTIDGSIYSIDTTGNLIITPAAVSSTPITVDIDGTAVTIDLNNPAAQPALVTGLSAEGNKGVIINGLIFSAGATGTVNNGLSISVASDGSSVVLQDNGKTSTVSIPKSTDQVVPSGGKDEQPQNSGQPSRVASAIWALIAVVGVASCLVAM